MNYGLITTYGTAGEPIAENGLSVDFEETLINSYVAQLCLERLQ